MRYENLKALLYNSSSGRKYFFSLNVKKQMQLHKYNDYIHSLFELKSFSEKINKYNKHLNISNSLFKNYYS